MTRQKNDIANGVRLENASWRTWWQKRLKLKTVNPQKLNWLKDSDVTWLYGPLHQAPTPIPPPKNATFEEKLSSIPPLPKGRKPILKKRTLAEVLVLGLAKTNNLTNEPPPADELKELDIDSRGTKGPEERDRIMLLHTKSDTNLLRPALQQPSLPSDSETASRRRPGRMALDRSSFSMSNKASPSPPPHEHEGATKKRVGFNTFVAQCIAIAPGERNSSDDDSGDDALSMKSGGSTSHGSHHGSHRPSMSRSNSHSSARSEPLIIAPMAPTLLKETIGDESCMSPLIYQPTKTPFDDSESSDDSDFDTPPVPPPKIVTLPASTPDVATTATAQGDLGGDEYNVSSKKRKLSAGETPPARRQFKESQEAPATVSTNMPTESTKDSLLAVASTEEDTRGRTLHRTSSSSSLNERSRSRNGNSPLGGHSPESSRASSNSTRVSSAEVSLTVHSGRAVTMTDPRPAAIPEETTTTIQDVDTPMTDGQKPAPKAELQAKSSPKLEPSGFVDKAVANAKGLIGSLLPSGSGASKRGTL